MPRSANRKLRAMFHSAESQSAELQLRAIFAVESNRISPWNWIYRYIQTALAQESEDPGVPFNEKTECENLVILSL
jgi:hypothetical protein